MEVSNEITSKNILNPLLRNRLSIHIDGEDIEITKYNLAKHFSKIYVLCPLKNEQIDERVFHKYIDIEVWNDLTNKITIYETTKKIIKNEKHCIDLTLINSELIKQFNHFGYTLEDNSMVLVLPILNISFLNIKKYLDAFEGSVSSLSDVYNLVLLNQHFNNTKLIINKNLFSYCDNYLVTLIQNMKENDYWTVNYNLLHNISKIFNIRDFRLTLTKNIDNTEIRNILKSINKEDTIEDNYLNMILSSKKHVDAASGLTKNGFKLYRIDQPCDLNKDEFNILFSKLDNKQKYFLFTNLMISKKYCHLVVNNKTILKEMTSCIKEFTHLIRYLLGYAWIRFYLEESIKKSYIVKEDEFIFDINTASLLPVFPFSINNPKLNPYITLLVDNNILLANDNIGGFPTCVSDGNNTNHINQGICNLDEFINRMNIFITGNSNNNVFNSVDWNEIDMAITGSIMTACLQKRHPLMSLLEGKNNFNNNSDFDLNFQRFLDEYYAESDVDIMIKTTDNVEFIKRLKTLYNQLVVNICGFNPYNAEPHHIRIEYYRTIYIYVTEKFIRDNLETEKINYDFIISNLESQVVLDLILPFIKDKVSSFYDNLSSKIPYCLKTIHPELFEENITNYSIHLKLEKEKKCVNIIESPIQLSDNDIDRYLDSPKETVSEDVIQTSSDNFEEIGINITFKAKIKSTHLQRSLEVFPVKGDDFFATVSTFHLPCVRSYYDGNNVYLTPSCITAHLTYMNLDYKYFAGKRDPIEIINKNRMRGFGTFLNKKEVIKFLNYSSQVKFWNNLYNIDINNKDSVVKTVGMLDYNHRIYHPRLYNADYYCKPEIPFVNINEGYNNINIEIVDTPVKIINYIESVFKSTNLIHMDENNYNNFCTIDSKGYISPVKKYLIEMCYNNFLTKN